MPELLDLTTEPSRFFDLLPPDWRSEIEPVWPRYSGKATIYGVADKTEVIAGAIVFSCVAPDTQGYRITAQEWFDKGYQYVGFLYVAPHQRGRGYGRMLLNAIPPEKVWLAIDDYGLKTFYTSLGFGLVQEVQNGDAREWILIKGK